MRCAATVPLPSGPEKPAHKNTQTFYSFIKHTCAVYPPNFTKILRYYHWNETFSILKVCVRVCERFNYEYFIFTAAYTNDWQKFVCALSSLLLGRLICTQRPLCELLSFHFSAVDLIRRREEQNSSQMFWTPLIFMTQLISELHINAAATHTHKQISSAPNPSQLST